MIGLLVIAHAPLADALLCCARHVYGCDPGHCDQAATLDVPPQADLQVLLRRARELCAGLDSGAGVLVLTDLFGATPANLAAELASPGRVEVLTGASLPMLLRALSYRAHAPLDILVEKAISGAGAGVIRISSNAPQNQHLSIAESDDGQARLLHNQ